MSGGSYDYLYPKDSPQSDLEHLKKMAARLEELGFPRSAARTRALLAPEADALSDLREIWHEGCAAIVRGKPDESRCSCGLKDVREKIAALGRRE